MHGLCDIDGKRIMETTDAMVDFGMKAVVGSGHSKGTKIGLHPDAGGPIVLSTDRRPSDCWTDVDPMSKATGRVSIETD